LATPLHRTLQSCSTLVLFSLQPIREAGAGPDCGTPCQPIPEAAPVMSPWAGSTCHLSLEQ